MKSLFFFLFIILASNGNAQILSGAVLEDGRKITGEPKYIVEGMKNGWAKYDLSVNIAGKVTSVTLVDSNLKSTPATTIIRNHVKKYTFEPGTYYPKFHHVIVKVTMLKGNVGNPQIDLD
ncbi:MAG: hypothetical protein P8P74_10720 [Crocinitomicaceae bacterium]|nr:hypothetical protein [Crocinitomicaceae bacterium]